MVLASGLQNHRRSVQTSEPGSIPGSPAKIKRDLNGLFFFFNYKLIYLLPRFLPNGKLLILMVVECWLTYQKVKSSFKNVQICLAQKMKLFLSLRHNHIKYELPFRHYLNALLLFFLHLHIYKDKLPAYNLLPKQQRHNK